MKHSEVSGSELTLVALGDIHAGSQAAVCLPENVKRGKDGEEDGIYKANSVQRGLYENWARLAEAWKRPDILLVNGDAIEGQARKESGVGCWTTDLDDQVGCAAKLIEMYEAKTVIVVNGTGYHVDAGGKSLEHHLGKALNAQRFGSNYSAEEACFQLGNYKFHASHHIAVGTGWYRSTPIARELVMALLNESDFHKFDVVLRSHVHTFCGVEFSRQHGYTLPAWQIRTRYMIRKSALGMTPTLGALRFRVRDDHFRLDKGFFRVEAARPKLYVYGK